MPDDTPPASPSEEITLEEWIASTQSCCGIEPESRPKPQPAETPRDDAKE